MSRIPSCILLVLLLLLCLYLLESDGRHLSTTDNAQISSHTNINKSDEKDQTTVPGDLRKAKTSESKKHEMAEKGSMLKEEDRVVPSEEKQADSKSRNRKEMMKGQRVKKTKGSLVRRHHHHQNHKSLATVTYHILQKKKGVHPQPGFNLDYSPPKTHPPSHN